jgi:hypothetical protein
VCGSQRRFEIKSPGVATERLASTLANKPGANNFAWSRDGTRIMGLSACGRATVVVLQLNNEYLVKDRRRWAMAGWHPPQE